MLARKFRHLMTSSAGIPCTDRNAADAAAATSDLHEPAIQGGGTVPASQALTPAVCATVRMGSEVSVMAPVQIRPRGRFRRDLATTSESQRANPSGTVPPRLSGRGSVRIEGGTD